MILSESLHMTIIGIPTHDYYRNSDTRLLTDVRHMILVGIPTESSGGSSIHDSEKMPIDDISHNSDSGLVSEIRLITCQNSNTRLLSEF